MKHQLLETPVLFLIFNRPDTTREVFAVIKEVKPKNLFIAADGPRLVREGEILLCKEARDIVLEGINWECDVRTLFRDENLGCGNAVSQAITWFFEQVEHGIILEDDCLPNKSFFQFAEELLIRYKNNVDIMHISGANLLGKWNIQKHSYFFAHCSIWGWASWKRAWRLYDKSMQDWPEEIVKNKIKRNLITPEFYQFYFSMFDSVYNGNLDTWDVQWLYSILIQDGKSITPSLNLVKNIGFNSNGTHTLTPDAYIESIPLLTMSFPLRHPVSEIVDESYIKAMYIALAKNHNKSKLHIFLDILKNFASKIFQRLVTNKNE